MTQQVEEVSVLGKLLFYVVLLTFGASAAAAFGGAGACGAADPAFASVSSS